MFSSTICLAILVTWCFNSVTSTSTLNNRYVTYTVNYGEGFNLRRDVYMRAVALVLSLREETGLNWILVLPPWPRLYHWKTPVDQNWLPWSRFFELTELVKIVPCLEFSTYLNDEGARIDEVLQLQRLEEPFVDGQYVETAEEGECSDVNVQWKPVFGNHDVQIGSKTCVFAQGRVSVLTKFLKQRKTKRSFMIRNFENLLHDEFGGIQYWKIRHSMVYSPVLRDAGSRYMMQNLRYTPGRGNGRQVPSGGGGEFIGAHLRRKDFLYSHKNTVPSLDGVVAQLNILLHEHNVTAVFVASDATMDEEFQRMLRMVNGDVYWYKPTIEEVRTYSDGGVAIIDQWILSHAQYFVGTAESTFSFRVREDRQFMGFSVESTFNDFCGPSHDEYDPHSCPRPTKWLLVDGVIQHSQNSKTEL